MAHVPDHLVSVLELVLGKVHGVALVAGLDHFVAFCLPRSLVQPGQVSRFYDIQKLCGLSIRVQHTESLQNGGPVLPTIRFIIPGFIKKSCTNRKSTHIESR
jgi:hypothetical protein